MRFFICMLLAATAYGYTANAQLSVDRAKFFEDTAVLKATLSLNFKKLKANSLVEGLILPALFTCRISDDFGVSDNMAVEVRGHFRRGECFLPPLKLIFKNNPAAAFFRYKSIKLVSSCQLSNRDEQNLLKEYLIYKMYNLLCDKSFRVRLLKLTYEDSTKAYAPVTRHAFLIEDIKDLAKRNDCFVREEQQLSQVLTERTHMTKVALFEYMIGNTDWSVLNNHNIKLITPASDSTFPPFVVPYDFDFSGLVNTNYATADDIMHLENVRQRLYRGYVRTEAEINEELAVFSKQKDNIYAIINNCHLLLPVTKKEMTNYLDDFFGMINNPKRIKTAFITNARDH